MSKKYLIINPLIVNQGKIYKGDVLIENNVITKITCKPKNISAYSKEKNAVIINAQGKYLFPGIIDAHVHFREPGLTHKADIYTESKAAVAGGITSYMEMPNTVPAVLTQELLEKKYKIASEKSLANYSFFFGASNDNINEILKTNPQNVCGVKIFMGSSTGNMLVDNKKNLENIFSRSKLLIAIHCEDEKIIEKNTAHFKDIYGENLPVSCYPLIRNDKACYNSSHLAVTLAKKYNTRLHILHLTTALETTLFDNSLPLNQKKITTEVCIPHLLFNAQDYKTLGTLIKCKPAIKTSKDQKTLLDALLDDKIDIITTDHAPHTIQEKQKDFFEAASGCPSIQHSLVAMLELYHKGKISLEKIAEKMCHAPAICYKIKKRGLIKKGYWADLTIVDLNNPWQVNKSNILYKCGWSPFQGNTFISKITHTFVNGNLIYENGTFNESQKGKRILFDRYTSSG